jgi:hypothetical protein
LRARNIKPNLFRNELLGIDEVEIAVGFLFSGLWCCADKEGRLEDRPLRIKADIFPYRTIESPVFNGWLTDLERMGFILRYEVDGKKIIQVINFAEHQSPHHTEKDSVLPPPPAELLAGKGLAALTAKSLLKDGESTDLKRSDSLIPDSLIPDSKGKEPPAPKKRKSAKPRDERIDHPAMKLVLEIMSRWPPKDLWDKIIRELGTTPDAVFFTACYEQWRSVNGNAMNLEKWLFEPARTKSLPEVYGNGRTHGNRPTQKGSGPAKQQRVDEIIADSQRFERPAFDDE